eukprot:gene24801-10720_t
MPPKNRWGQRNTVATASTDILKLKEFTATCYFHSEDYSEH